MKKILSIALCAAAASAFATDPEPATLGTVGVTAITTSLSNAIVAVSYDDLAGGEGMIYSNLVKTANLDVDDKLVEFRNGQYTGWVLKKNDQGVKYWAEQISSYQDGSGKTTSFIPPTASSITNAVGTGIWLMRQNPTEGGVAKTFYIYGKPSLKKTVSLAAKTWTLVGNPNQEAKVIGPTMIEGAIYGDQLVVPDQESGTLCNYIYKGATKGWKKNGDGDAPTIGAGLGCWIKTTNNDGATINW